MTDGELLKALETSNLFQLYLDNLWGVLVDVKVLANLTKRRHRVLGDDKVAVGAQHLAPKHGRRRQFFVNLSLVGSPLECHLLGQGQTKPGIRLRKRVHDSGFVKPT